ncbi:uncharacterized protein LOC110112499 [Dendrobium catenatum]|uniref:uncharacterized protein LOC110112499 n=1 Tax=Dendrobium catenatum TaxID=906689 RepID=UPI0009F52DA8|nr:uncharacterized protein LOC110112499 [Dendrobium catenatum]
MQDTPCNYKQAAQVPHWQKAMLEEFQALKKQGTWILVPPPLNKPILGCKWTYKKKVLPDGNDTPTIQKLLKELRTNFALKQLGAISLFLGIQTIKQADGLFLTQQHYAEKLLRDSNLTESKPAPTPSPLKTKQPPPDLQPFSDPTTYRRIAGSLQYLSITRPDIAFATNQICQHMNQPTNSDYQALKRLLRYIKDTITYSLPIKPGDLTLQSFTDAD